MSRGTQSAVASSRLRELAQPRRQQLQVLSSCRSEPRPTTQLASRTSAHIEVLASEYKFPLCCVFYEMLPLFCLVFNIFVSLAPKHNHPEYKGERPVCWPVSKAARHHVASQRLCELSYPKRRKALFEGYNPYVVSRAARSANPSTRIQELCLPLPRKYSSKEW